MLLSTLIVVSPAFAEHYEDFGRDIHVLTPQTFIECEYEHCRKLVLSGYSKLYSEYHDLHHNHTENIRTIEHLQDEVNVWQTKYNYLLAQQGNQTIQDKVANLTDRMDAVETKASTNESLIYIIQNMLRTVQTDIEDIYLKINSVR